MAGLVGGVHVEGAMKKRVLLIVATVGIWLLGGVLWVVEKVESWRSWRLR